MNLNTAFVFQETKRENKVNDPKQLGFRAAFSWVRHALLLQILFFQRKRSPKPKNINITALIYNSSIQAWKWKWDQQASRTKDTAKNIIGEQEGRWSTSLQSISIKPFKKLNSATNWSQLHPSNWMSYIKQWNQT